jgi:diadenylate cyclase
MHYKLDDLLRRLSQFRELSMVNLIHIIDILLVAYLVYRVLSMIRGTRAWRILGGVVIFIGALFLSDYLQLKTLHWVLDKATLLAPVALVLLLLPELKQTLEGFARIGLWPEAFSRDKGTGAQTVEEVVAAVAEMSASRLGAIIVIERGTHLEEIATNGVILNAAVSAALLDSIFYHGNPLHDGAVIIRSDTMRHRAGIGISEQSDAIAIIVSEEKGTVSVAIDGAIRRLSGHIELRDVLNKELRNGDEQGRRGRRRKDRSDEGATVA